MYMLAHAPKKDLLNTVYFFFPQLVFSDEPVNDGTFPSIKFTEKTS